MGDHTDDALDRDFQSIGHSRERGYNNDLYSGHSSKGEYKVLNTTSKAKLIRVSRDGFTETHWFPNSVIIKCKDELEIEWWFIRKSSLGHLFFRWYK